MKKEEFMQQIEGCKLPEIFDQHLLDNASEWVEGYSAIGLDSCKFFANLIRPLFA